MGLTRRLTSAVREDTVGHCSTRWAQPTGSFTLQVAITSFLYGSLEKQCAVATL